MRDHPGRLQHPRALRHDVPHGREHRGSGRSCCTAPSSARMERFFGILIEHYAGAFPVWLAPVQAVVIPIADRHIDYVDERARSARGRGRARARSYAEQRADAREDRQGAGSRRCRTCSSSATRKPRPTRWPCASARPGDIGAMSVADVRREGARGLAAAARVSARRRAGGASGRDERRAGGHGVAFFAAARRVTVGTPFPDTCLTRSPRGHSFGVQGGGPMRTPSRFAGALERRRRVAPPRDARHCSRSGATGRGLHRRHGRRRPFRSATARPPSRSTRSRTTSTSPTSTATA